MVAQLGLVKVLGLPQDFCFEGTAADIILKLASFLAVELPDSITNVVIGNSEPTDTQNTALWVRVDNSGAFVGLYTLNNGQWELLGSWNDWTPVYGAGGTMSFTATTDVARFTRIGNLVYFYIHATGTTAVSANPNLTFTLPVPAASATGLGGGSVIFDGGAGLSGNWIGNTTTVVAVRRYDAANYGLGADRGFIVRGAYEIS